MKMCRKFTAEG